VELHQQCIFKQCKTSNKN